MGNFSPPYLPPAGRERRRVAGEERELEVHARRAGDVLVGWYKRWGFLRVHFAGNLAWGYGGILKLEMEKAKRQRNRVTRRSSNRQL